MPKNTVETFRASKGKNRLSMLTAYDYTQASILNNTDINAVLVGDSLGMVMLGYQSTLPVTLEEMIHHCKAVAKALTSPLLICDMPFMSFQCGVAETLKNAGRLIKEGGAEAVKLEGGAEYQDEIRALCRASIPVMGHLGLRPQSVNAIGGYKTQGKTLAAAKQLVEDARAVEAAGAFSLVLECVPAELASLITSMLAIPVIGIGCGNGCDGQVLVWQDMVGMSGRQPKFVKKFAELGKEMADAFAAFDREVKSGDFPDPIHSTSLEAGILAELEGEYRLERRNSRS